MNKKHLFKQMTVMVVLIMSCVCSFSQTKIIIDCTDSNLLNTDLSENLLPDVEQPQVCEVAPENLNHEISGILPDNTYAMYRFKWHFININSLSIGIIGFFLNDSQFNLSSRYDVDLVVAPPAIDDSTFTRYNQFIASIVYLDKDNNYKTSVASPNDANHYFRTSMNKIDTVRLFENVQLNPNGSKVSLKIQTQCKITETKIVTSTFKLVEIILTPHTETSDEQVSYNGLNYRVAGDKAVVIGSDELKNTLSIPDSIEIGDKVYPVVGIDPYLSGEMQSVDRVEIPKTIEQISPRAFWNCQSIKEFNVDESNQTYKSEDGILYTKDGTRLICFPAGKTGKIVIPEGVTTIPTKTFYGSKLTYLEIPSTAVIASRTFNGLETDSLVLHTKQVRNWFRGNTAIKYVTLSKEVETLEPSAFSTCPQLEEVIIEDGQLTTLPDRAFSDCASLQIVILSSNLTSLGEYTFENDSSLKTITIPSGVTGLGTGLFHNCVSLKEAYLPQEVKSIGLSAFAGCESLTTIVLPDTMNTICEKAFEGCSALTDVSFPEELVSIQANAFKGCI